MPYKSKKARLVDLRDRLYSIENCLDILARAPDASIVFEGRSMTLADRELLERWKLQTRGEMNQLGDDVMGNSRFGCLTVTHNDYRRRISVYR